MDGGSAGWRWAQTVEMDGFGEEKEMVALGEWLTTTPAWPWWRPMVEKKGRGREMRCSQAQRGSVASARDLIP